MRKLMILAAVLGLTLVMPSLCEAGKSHHGCGSYQPSYGGCQRMPQQQSQSGYDRCIPPQQTIPGRLITLPKQEVSTSVKSEMAPAPAPLFIEF